MGPCEAPKGTNTKVTSAKGHFCAYPSRGSRSKSARIALPWESVPGSGAFRCAISKGFADFRNLAGAVSLEIFSVGWSDNLRFNESQSLNDLSAAHVVSSVCFKWSQIIKCRVLKWLLGHPMNFPGDTVCPDSWRPLVLPVSVKKTIFKIRKSLGVLPWKPPNQGLVSSFCRWIARQQLAEKECFFHGIHMNRFVYIYIYIYTHTYIHTYHYVYRYVYMYIYMYAFGLP